MPENMNLYCGIMNAKLNAVTAGHSFSELSMLIGTAARMRSTTPEGLSPVKTACAPKKYAKRLARSLALVVTHC